MLFVVFGKPIGHPLSIACGGTTIGPTSYGYRKSATPRPVPSNKKSSTRKSTLSRAPSGPRPPNKQFSESSKNGAPCNAPHAASCIPATNDCASANFMSGLVLNSGQTPLRKNETSSTKKSTGIRNRTTKPSEIVVVVVVVVVVGATKHVCPGAAGIGRSTSTPPTLLCVMVPALSPKRSLYHQHWCRTWLYENALQASSFGKIGWTEPACEESKQSCLHFSKSPPGTK